MLKGHNDKIFLKKWNLLKTDAVKVLPDKKNDSNIKYMVEFFN